jgi:uncharacterized protein YndB with AHSA1/START domain
VKSTPIVHGSFTIERSYRAAPARVFAAWTDIETKARWFMGPPERWKLLNRELDLRAGGSEILHGQLTNGTTTLFTARYHAVVPDERLVYAYDMHIGEKHLSVSLATVELAAAKGGGTRMTFTEHAAFLDGEDGTRSREAGTAAHFERLGPVLDDPAEIFASRVMDAPRDRVFQAFGDPDTLSRWWGPKGFRSTFQEHSLRPGGVWRLLMRGPDGAEYAMKKDVVDVAPPGRIVLRHEQPNHSFTMAIGLTDLGPRTLLTWRMQFDSVEQADVVRAPVTEANEQNFDRLAAHLAATGAA